MRRILVWQLLCTLCLCHINLLELGRYASCAMCDTIVEDVSDRISADLQQAGLDKLQLGDSNSKAQQEHIAKLKYDVGETIDRLLVSQTWPGPYDSAVKELAGEHLLANRVFFIGHFQKLLVQAAARDVLSCKRSVCTCRQYSPRYPEFSSDMCGRCLTVARDILIRWAHMPQINASRAQASDTMLNICEKIKSRHRASRASRLARTCESLVEGRGAEIVDLMLRLPPMLAVVPAWVKAEFKQALCLNLTSSCAKHVADQRIPLLNQLLPLLHQYKLARDDWIGKRQAVEARHHELQAVLSAVLREDVAPGNVLDSQPQMQAAGEKFANFEHLWKSPDLQLPNKLQAFMAHVIHPLLHGCELWRLDTKLQGRLARWSASLVTLLSGRPFEEEETDPTFHLVELVRIRRLKWVGQILRGTDDDMVRRALVRWGVAYLETLGEYPEGSLMMDAPRHESMGELIGMAQNKEGWDAFIDGLFQMHRWQAVPNAFRQQRDADLLDFTWPTWHIGIVSDPE